MMIFITENRKNSDFILKACLAALFKNMVKTGAICLAWSLILPLASYHGSAPTLWPVTAQAASGGNAVPATNSNPPLRTPQRATGKATSPSDASADDDTPPALPARAIPVPPASTPKATTAEDKSIPRLGWESIQAELDTQLDKDQKTISTIFNELRKANPPPSGMVLNYYKEQVGNVRKKTSGTIAQVQVYDTAITSILEVLGDKPAPEEDASVTAQRVTVQKTSRSIKAVMVRAKLYDLQARQLSTMIDTLRSHIEQITISKRALSPVTPAFWHQLLSERESDLKSLKQTPFKNDGMRITPPQEPLLVLAGGAISLLVVTFLGKLAASLLSRLSLYQSGTTRKAREEAKDRRDISLNPVACLVNGLVCSIGITLLWGIWQTILGLHNDVLSHTISNALPIGGFILGSGLPMQQWSKGKSHRYFGLFLVIGVILYAIIKNMQNLEMVGPALNAMLECSLALYISVGLYWFCFHYRRKANSSRIETTLKTQSGGNNADHDADRAIVTDKSDQSTLSAAKRPINIISLGRIIYPASVLFLLVNIIAILAGYLSFVFLVNGKLLSFIYALAVTGLLVGAWQGIIHGLLSPHRRGGQYLVQMGINARRLEQFSVLAEAFGILMLLMVFLALANNNGDISLSGLWKHLHGIFIGNNIHGSLLSPEKILGCIILLVGAHYLINFGRWWMTEKLFPTTRLNTGAQSSILSIFAYSAWIITWLSVLSLIGLSVQNLTWVVSALSVGVGFGLQSIVKDFISGLILLAERPVQAGDIIEIAGNRGEVRRVNVRATDIILEDGSTLIVPNSQFITANVKNASLDGMPASMSLTFTLSATQDLDKVRQLMLESVATQNAILRVPKPQIRITSLNNDNITLSLDISFARIREEEDIRDQLLSTLFQRFQQEKIGISAS